MKEIWKISVTELLGIYRETLLAIIPCLEKARIKWKEGESYDDWDNIVESLFENIVCSSLLGEVVSDYPMPKYSYSYDDYSSFDFIEVKCNIKLEKKYVFIAFQSINNPLDVVWVAEIDKSLKVVDYSKLKYDGLDFAFVKNKGYNREVFEYIEVIL